MSGEQRFWETLDLLIGHEVKKSIKDDIQEWVDRVVRKQEVKPDVEEKIRVQRSFISDVSSSCTPVDREKEIRRFFKSLKLPPIECTFSHPHVRARLEKLMGSNVVRLLNREYMLRLQERILEDYVTSMQERIESREAEERERVKNLVLTGKIPLDNAPASMADHPVMLIEMYCRRLIAERRAKIRQPKVQIPTHLYWDDTPDPPSGLSIEKGHIFRTNKEKLCIPPETFLGQSDEEDVEDGYMYIDEDVTKYIFKPDYIMELRACTTVAEMYELADAIIGPLRTVEAETRPTQADDAVSQITSYSTGAHPPPEAGDEQEPEPEPEHEGGEEE